MNLINSLDKILSDWTSPRVRRLVHALLALGLLVLTVWQAADGDWKIALASLAATLYAAANKANTPATPLTDAGVDDTVDDGLTYEEAGGGEFPENGYYEGPGKPNEPQTPPQTGWIGGHNPNNPG